MKLIVYLLLISISTTALSQQTEFTYLSGKDADSPKMWEFKISKGRKANEWSKIPVPSNWELHGFGEYNYGHDKNKSDEIGHYKYSFSVSEKWLNKNIIIVFEGVMTDTEVKINGISAGEVHQGGFYRFEYDITKLLKYDEQNQLDVIVKKVSDNKSIEIAERKSDYWVFGGIFRPVYLKILPNEHIKRTAIDARSDGSFQIDVYLSELKNANKVVAQIINKHGKIFGNKMISDLNNSSNTIRLKTKVNGQDNWTAEDPELYFVDVSLFRDKELLHSTRERFGFRTIEVKEGEGIFLNSLPITLKGCNRHSFYPTSGRALSRNKCYEDVMLLKEMNMNAVRMSHYPPDTYFLDLCDEYGIYVLDEVAGWQKPPYDTQTSERLIKQLVTRDVNHPSVLFWDNGNEGGWNYETDDEFGKYDPQNRRVLHPWEYFGGIDTDHYESYESVKSKMNSDNIFMPTEHLHGLYDGGHGAGLDDFWKLMSGNKLNGGMFLWVFADEGIIRTDKDWIIDTDGNHAPDGILGPFHEKEGSFYTIKEIWSPIYIESNSEYDVRDGIIPIANWYDFTNLKDCSFKWKLIKYTHPGSSNTDNTELASGIIKGPNVEPRKDGLLKLNLPPIIDYSDALHLTGFNKNNKEVFTWKWKLVSNKDIVDNVVDRTGGKLNIIKNDDHVIINNVSFKYYFSQTSGMLAKVENGNKEIPYNNGPSFVRSENKENLNQQGDLRTSATDNGINILYENHSQFEKLDWTIFNSGWIKLNYSYSISDSVEFMGVSFNYPEERMLSMKWLGKGPYRVWKNRLKGPTIDVWENQYKNFNGNTNWDYPEFVGYFDDFSWVVLNTLDGPITILTESEDLHLRLFSQIDGDDPRLTKMIWPEGDISFLHAIPAIGTKFHSADKLGPSSKKFAAYGIYEGTLFLFFGVPE